MRHLLHVFFSVAPVRQHGWTVPELVMAMAVVAIIGTAGIPHLQRFIASERQHAALNLMVTALHLARTEAILRRIRTVLCPSSDGKSCLPAGRSDARWEKGYIVFIDINANHLREPEERVVHVFDPNDALWISSAHGRDHVTYQASGMASGTNLSIHFCHRQQMVPGRTLVVSNSGRVRVVRADGNPAVCPG